MYEEERQNASRLGDLSRSQASDATRRGVRQVHRSTEVYRGSQQVQQPQRPDLPHFNYFLQTLSVLPLLNTPVFSPTPISTEDLSKILFHFLKFSNAM